MIKLSTFAAFVVLTFTGVVVTPSVHADNCHSETEEVSASTASESIVETARAAGDFTTLLSLLESSGLDRTLAAEGPFTVFAPNDDAFQKVPEATLAALQKDPARLKQVLTYHVVSGMLTSRQIMALNSTVTVEGSPVTITTTGGVKINNAAVVAIDIPAQNGVIHVIDAVLLP